MKVKFANRIYEVLFTKELAGLTMYAVEDEPNHIDWLINVDVVDSDNKELKKIEQKPAWSEDELDNITAAINNLEYLKNNYIYHPMGLEPAITFLKSLKDRVQPPPKQEWREEDDSKLKEVLYYIEYVNKTNVTFQQRDLVHLINWLKSLKDRVGNFDEGYKVGFSAAKHNQWKPSDEQMKVLDRAQAELCSTEYNKPICDLIDILNKLRGE